MNDIQLVVLVCTSCKLTFALQAEWLQQLEDDEEPVCVYCGEDTVGTLVSNAMEVS